MRPLEYPLYHLAVGEGWNTKTPADKVADNARCSRHMKKLGRKFKRTHLLPYYGARRDHDRRFTNIIRFTRIA